MLLDTIRESVINIVYPLQCVCCGRTLLSNNNQKYICQCCFDQIKKNSPPFCMKCGRNLHYASLNSAILCKECNNRHYFFDQACSVCIYEGIIKDLILMFKYQRRVELKTIFEELMEDFFKTFHGTFSEIDYIIPIPLSPTKYREREFNQTHILAEITCKILKKSMLNNILYRTKNTKPQANLNEQQRTKNIQGCFKARNAEVINSKNVLLVDDVLTTGITVSEAAKILKINNAKDIFVFTLAN